VEQTKRSEKSKFSEPIYKKSKDNETPIKQKANIDMNRLTNKKSPEQGKYKGIT
jgi:hypothetical protein